MRFDDLKHNWHNETIMISDIIMNGLDSVAKVTELDIVMGIDDLKHNGHKETILFWALLINSVVKVNYFSDIYEVGP